MILDTNALSDWLANEPAISELISALEEPPILTYVTLAEYRYGIAGSRYCVAPSALRAAPLGTGCTP